MESSFESLKAYCILHKMNFTKKKNSFELISIFAFMFLFGFHMDVNRILNVYFEAIILH